MEAAYTMAAEKLAKIIFLNEGYVLEVGGVRSEETEYGEGVTVEYGGETYVAAVDENEDGDATSLLDVGWVHTAVPDEEVEIVDETTEEDEADEDAEADELEEV